jgi:hypothetical protein
MNLEIGVFFFKKAFFMVFVFCNNVYGAHGFLGHLADYFHVDVEILYITKLYL